MRMGKVDSSYLSKIGYDDKTRVMAVEFTDGAVIRYYNVSPQTFRAIVFPGRGKSVGERFIELVRDKNYKFYVVQPAA